jgi:hypothetical protein
MLFWPQTPQSYLKLNSSDTRRTEQGEAGLNFVGTAKNGEGKLGWRDKEILRISSQKILRIEVELSRQLWQVYCLVFLEFFWSSDKPEASRDNEASWHSYECYKYILNHIDNVIELRQT